MYSFNYLNLYKFATDFLRKLHFLKFANSFYLFFKEKCNYYNENPTFALLILESYVCNSKNRRTTI